MQTFALLLFLFPALALAADAAPDSQTISSVFLQGLAGILAAVFTALLSVITATLRAKAREGKYWALTSRVWSMAQGVVAHAEAELRPAIQKALADGQLTPEEGAQLKKAAVALLRDGAMAQIGDLEKSFGLTPGGVDTLLSGMIERAIIVMKPAVPATPAPVTPPVVPDAAPVSDTPVVPAPAPTPDMRGRS